MTDHIDRAAEVLREHLSIAKETGEPDEVDCCARALAGVGLLATPEHDAAVAAEELREVAAAVAYAVNWDDAPESVESWLRERADRIEAGGESDADA